MAKNFHIRHSSLRLTSRSPRTAGSASSSLTRLSLAAGPVEGVPGFSLASALLEGAVSSDMTYFANALASALLQLTFWLLTKLSTVTAMARSMSCAEQYSPRRILQKASLMRRMASRWRTLNVVC